MTSRGKYVGLGAALVAMVVLAVAVFAGWSGLKEGWYLYRLRANDTAAQEYAADQLEKLGCTRPTYYLFRLRSGHVPYFTRSVDAAAAQALASIRGD